MKAKELRDKSKEELTTLLAEKRSSLIALRFDVSARQHKSYSDLKKTRKEIARILTILAEEKSKK
ncbi:MAG TPA: 50S ribosomal protein L29 [Candidatus Moranbacteria bacterium]|nr:50S ribosomal protein L29 [Candidatus Moranbacteria bacterium]